MTRHLGMLKLRRSGGGKIFESQVGSSSFSEAIDATGWFGHTGVCTMSGSLCDCVALALKNICCMAA